MVMQPLFPTHGKQPLRHVKLALGVLLSTAFLNKSQAQFTYSFTAVSGTYTQVSAGGSDLNSVEVNDAHSASIPLGFTFGYNGQEVTDIRVNSNGWISMDDSDSPSSSDGRSNSTMGSAPNNVRPGIMPLWDDLDGNNGTARYETTGSVGSRIFTMEWRNWQWNEAANNFVISFQCKLYEGTNVIEFIYRQEANPVNSGSASIGLLASSSGTYYSLNNTGTGPTASTSTATTNLNTKPATGQIYRFTPTGCSGPTISSTTSNSPLCAGSTLNLNTSATGTAPLSYLWSGTGTFSDVTDNNPSVTGAATGTYSVTVKNWCGTSVTDNESVTVSPQPTSSNAGPDQTICTTTASVTLAANTPSAGTGAWSILAGSPSTSLAQLSSTTSPTATFTPAGGAGTYNLRWTISSSPCTASTNDVAIIVNAPPATANAGGDQTICVTATATLAANSASPGTGAWTILAGSPSTSSGQLSNTSSPTAVFDPSGGPGTYTLRWTTSRAPCASTQDEVVINVTASPTASNAGPDQTICITTPSVILAANTPTAGSGSWTILGGSPSTSLAQLSSTTSPTATFTHTGGAGTYTLRWTISNSPCAASTNDVAIIVRPEPTVANAGLDQEVCTSPGSATLSGNAASVGTDSWSFVSGPVTPNITSSGSPTTTVTGMTTAGTYIFQWNITNTPCAASTDQVSILVKQTPSASASSNTPVCQASQLTLIGTTNIGTTFSWTGPGGFTSTDQNPSITNAALSNAGTYNFTATHNGCTSSVANTVVEVNERPTVPAILPPAPSICAGGSVGLTASSSTPPVTFTGGSVSFPFFGTSTPYPSAIVVSGLPTSGVTVQRVTLNGVTHTNPDDIEALLRSPLGTNVILMSDAGGGSDISGNNYVFQDGSPMMADGSPNASGTYAPTNYGTPDDFPAPGPGSVSQASPALSMFTGNMNGTWNLYSGDDGLNINSGSITSWSITFNVPVSYAWAPPAGLSGTSGASVTASPAGTSTYTVTASNGFGCMRTGDVTVTVVDPADAGTDGAITVCSTDPSFDLFALLGGTPEAGGSWSGPSPVIGGMYDPAAMAQGAYVYSVTAAPCTPNTATVSVTETPATAWYGDPDNDGAGDPNDMLVACAQPGGYVANDDDVCPGGPEPGTACDDANPFTVSDMLDGSCACVGTPIPCTENVVLELNTDGAASQTSWEIKDDNSPVVVCSGSGYPNNTTVMPTCCLVPGCYVLNVFDSFGDGIASGGYLLRTADGNRIIDNANDGQFGTVSSAPLGFCVPMGQRQLTIYTCDREDLSPTSVIVASPDPAVQAQFGSGNQADDGYQFWIFNPDGGYSRRIYKSHASPGAGGAAGMNACAHLKLSSIITNPVPTDVLLNVRVRARVNDVDGEFGPACRMKVLGTPLSCPTTKLDDNPLHIGTTYSCGVTGLVVSPSTKLWAFPVAGANKYQFEFAYPAEGYTRHIASSNYVVTVGPWVTSPLICGTLDYQVRVRASFDNGATWCAWGDVCTVEITNNAPNPCTSFGTFNSLNALEMSGTSATLWPNPVRDGRVQLELNGLSTDVMSVRINVVDLFGKQVMAQTIATGGAEQVNTVLDLDADLAKGLYLVHITAGPDFRTERLVVE